MNRQMLILILLFLAALVLMGGVFWTKYGELEERIDANGRAAPAAEPELAEQMAALQYYGQKLMLATGARNDDLAQFYLHEVEEMAGKIASEIPEYETHAIGRLIDAMLVPQIELLEGRLEASDWAGVDVGLERLVDACNGCHAATDHGFIDITLPSDGNLFNQRFSPQP